MFGSADAIAYVRIPNLHTAPKRHLFIIEIKTFLKKSILIWKKKFARCFQGLRHNQIS